MARNKSVSAAGYDAIMLSAAGTCTAASYAVFSNQASWDNYALFVTVPLGIYFASRMLDIQRLLNRKEITRYNSSVFQNDVKIIAPLEDPDFSSWLLKWRDGPAIEDPKFVFKGAILPAPIHEDDFYRVIDIGINRQNHWQWQIAGSRIGNRLTATQIWGESHYGNKRPRIRPEIVRACKIILVKCQLFHSYGQGHPGLLHDSYIHAGKGADRVLEICRRRWLKMYPGEYPLPQDSDIAHGSLKNRISPIRRGWSKLTKVQKS